MKNLVKIVAVSVMLSVSGIVRGQEAPDMESPLLKYTTHDQELTIAAGARMMADAAWYGTEFTPMKSGAAITDARIRASLSYKKLYLFADFDLSRGSVTQKDIYARYNLMECPNGIQAIKAGYYAEPSSMSMMTSIFSYHFLTRPGAVNALAPGRALGVTYNYFNTSVTLTQGVFAENAHNHQHAGNQGVSVGGRWVYKAVNDGRTTFHIGVSARFAQMNTGYVNNGTFTTGQVLSSTMQTYVDRTTQFLSADLPWARQNINLGGELLFRSPRFFARGEYIVKRVNKERPDMELFTAQLGDVWSWTTLESWQKGNPLRSSKFDGGYLELGYLLKGDRYGYNEEYANLGGTMGDNSWELVARYSYTNLNDITEGDWFLFGADRFYNGPVSDYPPTSTSVGGGRLHAFTFGVNYAYNRYFKMMAEYQYGNLDNVHYPLDKKFHQVQMRVMFGF